MANRTTVGPLKEGESVVSDNLHMANILNKFFSSVFTVEDENVPEPTQYTLKSKLCSVDFNEKAVSDKIDALRGDSAGGPDKIGPRHLKNTSDILCAPIAFVLRVVFRKGLCLMIGGEQM